MNRISKTFKVKVWGDFACFTRPEFKSERVSYKVIPPSAARGILESILWKPAIQWHIEQIDVLKNIKTFSIKKNEVSAVGNGSKPIYADEQRMMRSNFILRDVAYVIHAHFEVVEEESKTSADTVKKFETMFNRRVSSGQCYRQPFLGMSEYHARFEFASDSDIPIDVSEDFGNMPYKVDYSNNAQLMVFRARMNRGIIVIPELNPVRVSV